MKRIVMSLFLLAIALLMVGCVGSLKVGATQTDSQSVELGGAESVRVDVEMGLGKVQVSGGAASLMDAEFTYNIEDWKPEVAYTTSGSEGRLSIRQPSSDIGFDSIPDNEVEYEWDVRLNDDVPMHLDFRLGVGDSSLDLSGLSLDGVDVEMGVGQADIDLTGAWQRSFDVDIRGGVGKTTIHLPDNVGVRVDTQTGIGAINVHGLIRNGDVYTNDKYEGADVVLDIKVQGGVGEINLETGE